MNFSLLNSFFIVGFILSPYWHIHVSAQETSFVQWLDVPEFTIFCGEDKIITLSFGIKESYHIQANQVKNENLIPTTLYLKANHELTFGDPVFPKGDELKMKGVEEKLSIFSEIMEIQVPINTNQLTKKGAYFVEGQLHYQACDNAKCYFPRNLNFVFKITLE